jgi:hypothetical protein
MNEIFFAKKNSDFFFDQGHGHRLRHFPTVTPRRDAPVLLSQMLFTIECVLFLQNVFPSYS